MNGVSPVVVALLRGILEAILLAAIGVLITALSEVSGGQLAPYAPVGLVLLRQLEGVVDAMIDPTRQRVVGGRAA